LTYFDKLKFLSSASMKLLTSSSIFWLPVASNIFLNASWYSYSLFSGIIHETFSLLNPYDAF
jgi:hypothetical protein